MGEARSTIIQKMIDVLKATGDFTLVKPYFGELDRYRKVTQLQSEIFPAEVNLQTPFALVISKEREVIEGKNRTYKFKHNISIYIGTENPHDFVESMPSVFPLLTKAVNSLRTINELYLVNEGLYMIRTDLFIIYDQQWCTFESY